MKTKIAIVSNVVATQMMVEALNQRAHGVPGIGLIYGVQVLVKPPQQHGWLTAATASTFVLHRA